MGNLAGLLDSLDSEPTRRGAQFEHLCKWFLENDPRYAAELERVWLWADWPGRWGPDAGIDLVARARGGELWAVQAKAYDASRAVTKADVDSFLSESSRPQFAYRLLIATTDLIGANARRTLIGQEKQVGHLLLTDLLSSPVHWFDSVSDPRPSRAVRKAPRPHQEDAVVDVVACLGLESRARLVMACGTGKTLTALFVAEKLAADRSLVLVPSLSLLAQTLSEWLANCTRPIEYLAVCSDESVADSDAILGSASDLGVPVSTDPQEIATFLRRTTKAHRVVFATYQSSQRVAEAMTYSGVPDFDLAVADEAHRCTGPVTGVFATILDDTRIRADKRLFMTATPRYYTGRLIKEAGESDLEIASMDEAAVFGPLAHRLTFAKAIRDGLLADYQVVIIGVDDRLHREWITSGRYVATDGTSVTDARTLASHIGLAKAMREFDLQRVITFHNRVARADRFARMLPEVIAWIPEDQRPVGTLDAALISGHMAAGDRRRLLQRLRDRQADRALLANARCLTEGVDVPALDGVAFIDPRRSEIDVIQAVGRAIRRSPNKTVGTIVLPVFISDAEDPDAALNDSAFKPVWQVLNALRAHDEELAEQLDTLRRGAGLQSGATELPSKVVLELPTRVSSEFIESVKVRLVEQTTSSWECLFGLLEEYVDREGDARVPQLYRAAGRALGFWVSDQRKARRTLSADRQARLQALPGWEWEVNTAKWDAGYAALVQFAAREGHARVPTVHVEGEYPLGRWVANQRTARARMSTLRTQRLEAVPGWAWDVSDVGWEAAFDALVEFAVREGHARVPVEHRERDVNLGRWVANQRSGHHALPNDLVARLEAVPGWTWSVTESRWEDGFAALVGYVAREGHAHVPKRHNEGGLNLGQWVVNQRGHRAALTEERRSRLQSVSGWSWDPLDTQWETTFRVLTGFVAREGHARVPKRHREGDVNLGTWIATQRAARDELGPDRRERLAALPGWTWDSIETSWQNGLDALAAFAAREGHLHVPNLHVEGSFKLGSWVRNQRDGRARTPASRRALLDALPGWTWNSYDADWERAFSALEAFVRRHGNALVPTAYAEDDLNLGSWVSHQRKARDTVSPGRRQRLEALPGWTWNALDDRWESAFAALRSFAAREGHADVPQAQREGGMPLGVWVRHQRAQREKMPPRRRHMLEALPGWTWDANSDSWEKGFAALLRHVAREGTAQVRKRSVVDGMNLGAWVVRQRQQRADMDPLRADRLQALPGWSWDPQADKWNAGLTALVSYAQREGHTKVPATHSEGEVGLGRWARAQRARRNSLTPAQRTMLESVDNWVW